MPETITPNPARRRIPAGFDGDMAFAVEFTGRTRQTLLKAISRGLIPGATQLGAVPNSPWYFTEAGLRHYLGERDTDTAGAA